MTTALLEKFSTFATRTESLAKVTEPAAGALVPVGFSVRSALIVRLPFTELIVIGCAT